MVFNTWIGICRNTLLIPSFTRYTGWGGALLVVSDFDTLTCTEQSMGKEDYERMQHIFAVHVGIVIPLNYSAGGWTFAGILVTWMILVTAVANVDQLADWPYAIAEIEVEVDDGACIVAGEQRRWYCLGLVCYFEMEERTHVVCRHQVNKVSWHTFRPSFAWDTEWPSIYVNGIKLLAWLGSEKPSKALILQNLCEILPGDLQNPGTGITAFLQCDGSALLITTFIWR